MSAWSGGHGYAEAWPCLIRVHLLFGNAQRCPMNRRFWSGWGNLLIRCASLSSVFLSYSKKKNWASSYARLYSRWLWHIIKASAYSHDGDPEGQPGGLFRFAISMVLGWIPFSGSSVLVELSSSPLHLLFCEYSLLFSSGRKLNSPTSLRVCFLKVHDQACFQEPPTTRQSAWSSPEVGDSRPRHFIWYLNFLLGIQVLWKTQDGDSPHLHPSSLELIWNMEYFHGHM